MQTAPRVSEKDLHQRSAGHHTEPEPEEPAAEPTEIYPAGTCVQYKSRSSGQWILARVEGYDESAQVYRLDVQPYAHPDRVRLRRPRKSQVEAKQETDVPKMEHQAAKQQAQCNDDAFSKNGAGNRALRRISKASSEPSATSQHRQSREQASRVGNARNIKPEDHNISESDIKQLIQETLMLKNQVGQMEVEINGLQNRVTQEAVLKDRYFAELCLCREALQRVCDSVH